MPVILKRFFWALCFTLPLLRSDCRAEWTKTTPAHEKVASAPSGLDRYLRDSFVSYLGEQKGNQPAAEIHAYLLAHPKLEFRVVPGMLAGSGGNRYWALYDKKNDQIRISNSFVTSSGYSGGGVGMSIDEFNKFIAAAAPLLVHETVHAQVLSDLGFEASGALENELLAYAYAAWYLKSDPALAKPEHYKLGATLYERLAPLASSYARTSGKIASARRAKLVHDVQKSVSEVRRELERGDPSITEYSLWVAFTKGWPAFSAYAHLFTATKGPVLAGPAQIGSYIKYLEKLKADAAKETKEDTSPVFNNLLSFWSDPGKVSRAQAYFRERVDSVAASAAR
jgi:hypothetical protein